MQPDRCSILGYFCVTSSLFLMLNGLLINDVLNISVSVKKVEL